jgi:HPt (histidine-containing phosphotransfer) domain-containing protein
MASMRDTAASKTFGDHEVIKPENKLRKAVSSRPFLPGEEHPIARAERALAELSTEFVFWMDAECDRLDNARRAIIDGEGFSKANKDALFHAAHDIKGEAATFGFPAVAGAAESLCRLLELTPDAGRIPVKLLDQHVDAVRAIYREYSRSDAVDLALELTKRLREVTDEFLIKENVTRPDVLAKIVAPPVAPE